MIKRIDLIMPPLTEYGALCYYTKKLYEALGAAGVSCRLLVAEKSNPKPFLESLFSSKPDCTLSFNGLLPDSSGQFFCDMIKIPHVALLTQSPLQFLSLTKSKRNFIGCPDEISVEFLKGLKFESSFYFPHCVDSKIVSSENKKKKYELVFFASCIDYKAIEEKWKSTHSKELQELLHQIVTISLQAVDKPLYEVVVEAINQQEWRQNAIDPSKIDMIGMLDDLEIVISGKARVEMLGAIKHPVSVFGAGPWEKYLKANKNVTICGVIPFEEVQDILKESKLSLDSSPNFKKGVHERLLLSLACGAAPLVEKNQFVQTHFKEDSSSLYYTYGKWDELNEKAALYFQDDEKREALVQQGRKVVMRDFTFDAKAKELIKTLSNFLA